MGAWGCLAFDNDEANDWAFGLDDVDDLSLVESTLDALDEGGDDYLEQDLASSALAACEVLARCLGHAGYTNAYTEKVDTWVASNKPNPTPALLEKASAAIDRILGADSELRELWEESQDADAWRMSVADLRGRLKT